MKVTAIFDIGKTNKKFFLFDENYNVVHKEYIHIDEIKDDDGHNCDDLSTIEQWIKKTLYNATHLSEFDITKINFSTYGATFVHIDKNNKVVSPLYNYLKPYPDEVLDSFYAKHGSKLSLAKETASPPLQMLNSGLQLYYIKYAKPDVFKKIRWSMHLPQYFSFLITGIPSSEYTSIGCHTMLWNYESNDYHKWVYEEEINNILPPIVDSNSCYKTQYEGQEIEVGVGIHDSSAALIPYIKSNKEPFVLLSTGTWSIALNPFNDELLTEKELASDCLNFLQTSGKTVKAARLFLGNEYKIQIGHLETFFKQNKEFEQDITFDVTLFDKAKNINKKHFRWESLANGIDAPDKTMLESFDSIEETYHQLMFELVQLQINAIKLALGKSKISTLYVDGGFVKNKIFLKMLDLHFKSLEIKTSNSPLGSALGAALVITNR